MKRKVTVTFELDTDEYGDVGENDSPEDAMELVEAMFKNDADWPWECDVSGLNGPSIVIE